MKHSGEPTGRILEFGGVKTYVSEPKSGKPRAIVLYFPDAHGPFHPDTKLLQDHLAENGFLVLGIDYLFGDGLHHRLEAEPDFDKYPWLLKIRGPANEAVPKWVQAVRDHYGADKAYAALGYWFGGTYALDMAGTDNVVVAAIAHPSPAPSEVREQQFKKVKQPLLILASDKCEHFPAETRRQGAEILRELGVPFHARVFTDVDDGWTVRGHHLDNNRWAKEEAVSTVLSWFARYLPAQRA